MANLIECPTCKQQISENAISCPHCGEPIAKTMRPEDDRKVAPVWVLPITIIANNAYFVALVYNFATLSYTRKGLLIIMVIFTAVSGITLFISGSTANNEYKAHGVSVAALFISILNVLIGLVSILLTVSNGI